ncbi:3-hydroxyacyl-CoA dehydrogenase family protein [Gammaproteobacteria bacterium]|nr:3-hydroxyacyl-CoA dehydrogenase family protein [Gammaproteobacteria bacterium]
MNHGSIKKVCFIGAGTMGCFNSLMVSVAGYECVIYDPSKESLASRQENQKAMGEFLSHSNFFNGVDIATSISKIKNESNLINALAGAHLISESIPENFDLKIKVLKEVESLVSNNAILTTNTSSLSVTRMSQQLNPVTNFAAMHFHLGSRLVDLVRGANTSETTIKSLQAFVKSINGYPLVLKKESPGYALNAMLGGLFRQSMLMVIEGLYSIEEIDGAWKDLNKSQFGPFGMMDMFGLDVVKGSWDEKEKGSSHIIYKEKILGLLSKYTSNESLGMKTGKGFYDYSKVQNEHEKSNYIDIQKNLRIGIIESALVLLADDILEKDQINKAWIVGMLLEQGPFDILNAIGVKEFKKQYKEWLSNLYISSENSQKISKLINY